MLKWWACLQCQVWWGDTTNIKIFGILPMMEHSFLVKENWVIQKIHRGSIVLHGQTLFRAGRYQLEMISACTKKCEIRHSDWTESNWWADQGWPLTMHVPRLISLSIQSSQWIFSLPAVLWYKFGWLKLRWIAPDLPNSPKFSLPRFCAIWYPLQACNF